MWHNVLGALELMTEFARDIHTFMVASLPELEELVQDYDENEKLSTTLLKLLQSLEKNLESAAEDCADLWEVLEVNFPMDKEEFGGRFSCKQNSIHESIRKLKAKSYEDCLESQRDVVSNYSELVLMDLLECSFLLILAVMSRLNGHQCGLRKEALLNRKLHSFTTQLGQYRSVHDKNVEDCETIFQRYFEELEAMESGSPLSIENRFSMEYKLYQNSESMSKILAQISETLGSIQRESLSMLPVMKSHDEIDDSRDSTTALFTAQQARAEQFQKLQITLESKVSALNKFWKLENQLLRKIVQRSFPKSSSRIDLYHDGKEKETQQSDLQQSLDFDESDFSAAAIGPEGFEHGADEEDEEEPVVASSQCLDEFYELVMGKDENGTEKDHGGGNEDQEDEQVQEARQIVLEQLKTVLKPRHEAMKTREEEAYRRAYGEKPVESDSDESDEPVPDIRVKRIKQEIHWGDVDQEDGTEDADVFRSDDDDEINSEGDAPVISADFRSKLDSILKTGGGFPISHLSSSPDDD